MTMTQKDFQALADAVAYARNDALRQGVDAASGIDFLMPYLIVALKASNSAFDAERFKRACAARGT